MAQSWEGLDGAVATAVEQQNVRLLDTYRADPGRVEQDANIERSIAEGAYAKRQLFELLQNAADATRAGNGRCEVVLTERTLYVANSGEPVSVHGVETLMATHRSAKRDEQIGRFGLGFKSVLAVSDSPRIFSKSGSFGFDRKDSEDILRALVPGASHYPVTRLATALDPSDWSRGDPVLGGLMKWATTVVVLPLKGHREVLARSMEMFPAEFLLFSQHVERLDVDDRVSGRARSITLARHDSGALLLNDASKRSLWVVRSEIHTPSKAALADGGYQAARERVDTTWAAPVEGAPKGVGTFWAYFPTTSGTTLSGIVNAPWKLADDRESLLAGPFNDELLTRVLPRLVADTIASVHRPGRPTAVLDVLPARGKESRNHADDIINEPVMKAVSERQCIPTLGGGLRHPTRVRLHPEKLEVAELELWASACPDPDSWVHHAVLSAEHRAKVVRLLGYHGRTAVTIKDWVEHLVKEPTVEGSAAAVQLVASLKQRSPEPSNELSRARVLLLEDGTVHACARGQVFLPGGTEQPGHLIISPALAGDVAVVRALNRMGIEIFDNAGELRNELSANPIPWDRVWFSARKNTLEESSLIFREVLGDRLLLDLRVRTYSGKWASPSGAFLPGEVVPADGSRDGDFLVDPRFHQQDMHLLDELGLVSAPQRLSEPPLEAWRRAQRDEFRQQYRRRTGQPRLTDEVIDIDEGRVAWPLEPMTRMSDAGRGAMTEVLLRQFAGDELWRVTRRGSGPANKVIDPTWFFIRDYGRLRTQIGLQSIRRCLRLDEEQAQIEGVPQPLPFVHPTLTEAQADALNLKENPGQIRSDDWAAILDEARAWPEDRRFLLYAWAAFVGQPPPDRIRVRKGPGFAEVRAPEAAVSHRPEIFESLRAAGVPALFATSKEDFDALRDGWGMPDGAELLVETVDYELAGELFVLIDRYPPLRLTLGQPWHDLQIQPCKRLDLLTSTPEGQQSRPLQQHLESNVVYTTAVEDRDILVNVARAIGESFKPDVVIRRMEEQRRNQLRQKIAETTDVLDKLILAVGVDDLRRAIPAAALEGVRRATGGQMEDRDVARLALAVDGYSILQAHRPSLDKKQLDPPSMWAGRRSAREWIRRLGFPVEFAGFAGQSRAAEIEVEGPPVLGDLHHYQVKIAAKIRGLLVPESEMRRGLLSLPTGAGKTRVAVQALVEHMAEATEDVRILWVAETDELCEQATQTWSQVWRSKGRAGVPMTLSRLWSGNEANERDGHQVVVASLAKLDFVTSRKNGDWESEYGWLAQPTMIVVDEAHRSVTSQYTRTLSAIGRAANVASMTTPLLGLTATPFRGFNARETEALAGRYHRHLLDAGVFPNDDVYAYLQDMGVLARINHRELRGADLILTEDEKQRADLTRRLPETVEKRLGRDEARNSAIVESVIQLGPNETALLFATSVENARVLAALLTFHGVESRAVSSNTDPHARRRYIEDFKAKRVRVLTNYNVFTEGFDVPKVDAVFITRPTFSPNIYQQMIGRGLRGPLNGGKDDVLIVNVADNLTNFGLEFAFRHFEHLWKRGAGS